MEQQEIIQNEIAELEAKLQAKKKEIAGSGAEIPEKETLREVIQEHASVSASDSINPTAPAVSPAAVPTKVASTAPNRELSELENQKINDLIEQAFATGIAKAVTEAKKTGDAFFIDALHDRLVDQYYEKLIQSRKLKQL